MNRPTARAGDWMEVRSPEEILATLDDRGRLEALPFMPEMLRYCGKRFRIFKSAHKTCDTIVTYKARRMTNAVHLEGLRCDGEAHGGCQAGCLLFWKEAWLKPVAGPEPKEDPSHPPSETRRGPEPAGSYCDLQTLARATRVPVVEGASAKERYSCQATEMLRATTQLDWWDPRQYIDDVASGNVRLRELVRYGLIAAFNAVVRRLHPRLRTFPYVPGLADEETPPEALNLQPGELVQIRTKAEIMRTINANRKNRGLWFDVEMVPYCGRTFRVLRRVERIINEKTGVMRRIPSDCLVLDGVTCVGCLSRNRLFCPRSIYPYWREIWLKRIDEAASGSGAPTSVEPT